ncbi:hypothetical protein GCM10027176_50900 [Actinoallomurus bryophytorum]|uniref:hypothetical protein n=1 Tax=Actinoallomurus bryophytorum TaxID=1490222 RepID=UPI001C8A33E8|nr:hypothetical protein [Actinoallomurus bryophytorum]
MVIVNALHSQRNHVTYLAERGARWILTVKGNQPSLHHSSQLYPGGSVPDATSDADLRTRPPRDLRNEGPGQGDGLQEVASQHRVGLRRLRYRHRKYVRCAWRLRTS